MCNRKEYHRQWSQHKAEKMRRYHAARKQAWRDSFLTKANQPPANVLELDDKYELYLSAPGYEKSDFVIAILDQRLSITVKEKKEEDANWKRKEFSTKDFVRQFELDEKIDKSNIEAKYENGVLKLTLPKLEGFETTRQEISIA